MIKLTFVLRRRADFTQEAFLSYWLNEHGPLVESVRVPLGIRRYVQTHSLATPLDDAFRASREAAEPYDGVAELWWDDLETLVASVSSDEGVAAGRLLLEDERRFIDLARSSLWLGEEHEIIR